MFVETSAIVAIVAKEPGFELLVAAIEAAGLSITSPLNILEASMVVSSRLDVDPLHAEVEVRVILDGAGVVVTNMTDETASLAIEAFARYGKGRGHPAQLNLADCLSYACAKQHRVPLLYVGNDFAQTDLA